MSDMKTIDQQPTADGKIRLVVQESPTVDASEQAAEQAAEQVPPYVQLLLDMFVTHTDRPVYA